MFEIPENRTAMMAELKRMERKQRQEASTTNNIITTPTNEKRTAYRSYVKLGRFSTQAQWDTGAEVSVIAKSLALKSGLPIKTVGHNPMTLTFPDGTKQKTSGIIEQAKLKIGDVMTSVDIHVVEMPTHKENFLIGSNWFNKYSANVLLNDRRVEFKVNGRKYTIKIVLTENVKAPSQVGYIGWERTTEPNEERTPPPQYEGNQQNDEIISIGSSTPQWSDDESDDGMGFNELREVFSEIREIVRPTPRPEINIERIERIANQEEPRIGTAKDLKQRIAEWEQKLEDFKQILHSVPDEEEFVEEDLNLHQIQQFIKGEESEDEGELDETPANYLASAFRGEYGIEEYMDDAERDQYYDFYNIIGDEAYRSEIDQAVKTIIEEFDDVVSKGPHDIGNCITIEHAIRLNNENPHWCKNRRRQPREVKWIEEQIKEMVNNGVIEPANSEYAHNSQKGWSWRRNGLTVHKLCTPQSKNNNRPLSAPKD